MVENWEEPEIEWLYRRAKMLIPKRSAITFSELISFVLSDIDNVDDNFCIYTSEYLDEIPSNMEVYIDDYPDENEDGEDLYPIFTVNNDLELIYYGEQFFDVIKNAIHQKPEVDINGLVEALNYYMDHDNFITLVS